jgi:hypothetical protein
MTCKKSGSYSEVQLLECSFDKDENRIVASRQIESGFCTGEGGVEIIDEGFFPQADDHDEETGLFPIPGNMKIDKSRIPADVRPLVNLLTIFAIGVLFLTVIDRYAYGNESFIKDICSVYRFQGC